MTINSIFTPQLALLLGFVLASIFENPIRKESARVSKLLIQASIVLLGFTMDISSVLAVSAENFLTTTFSISLTLILGHCIAKIIQTDKVIAQLISVGTAICGGSAIAAVAAVIVATEAEIAISIACVFIWNAIALYLLPLLGHALELSELQFGRWAGISIHDISSVVGAAASFGPESLTVATTIKLSRTLWIIPLCFFYSQLEARKQRAAIGSTGSNVSALSAAAKNPLLAVPPFIILYILSCLYNSAALPIPIDEKVIVEISKFGFSFALFLIGANTSFKQIRKTGLKPLVMSLSLWIVILLVSLVISY
jgi:uncharacterized integral membrane protein (TIGR00698 family)